MTDSRLRCGTPGLDEWRYLWKSAPTDPEVTPEEYERVYNEFRARLRQYEATQDITGQPVCKVRAPAGIRTQGVGGRLGIELSEYTTRPSMLSLQARAGARSALRMTGRAHFWVWVVDTGITVGGETWCLIACSRDTRAY